MSSATGNILWSKSLSTYHDLAADEGQLYLTDEGGAVLALDRRSGAILWKQDALSGKAPTAPVLDQGLVVVGDGTGRLHWLLPEDGTLITSYELSQAPLPGPLVPYEGALYLKDRENAVYGLRAEKVRGGG